MKRDIIYDVSDRIITGKHNTSALISSSRQDFEDFIEATKICIEAESKHRQALAFRGVNLAKQKKALANLEKDVQRSLEIVAEALEEHRRSTIVLQEKFQSVDSVMSKALAECAMHQEAKYEKAVELIGSLLKLQDFYGETQAEEQKQEDHAAASSVAERLEKYLNKFKTDIKYISERDKEILRPDIEKCDTALAGTKTYLCLTDDALKEFHENYEEAWGREQMAYDWNIQELRKFTKDMKDPEITALLQPTLLAMQSAKRIRVDNVVKKERFGAAFADAQEYDFKKTLGEHALKKYRELIPTSRLEKIDKDPSR